MLCVSYVAIESIYVYDYLGKQNNMNDGKYDDTLVYQQ